MAKAARPTKKMGGKGEIGELGEENRKKRSKGGNFYRPRARILESTPYDNGTGGGQGNRGPLEREEPEVGKRALREKGGNWFSLKR